MEYLVQIKTKDHSATFIMEVHYENEPIFVGDILRALLFLHTENKDYLEYQDDYVELFKELRYSYDYPVKNKCLLRPEVGQMEFYGEGLAISVPSRVKV